MRQALTFAPKPGTLSGGEPKDTAFTHNRETPLHRWVPWIAGFSASFVDDMLKREEARRKSPMTVLDPFAGVGTTLVEAMLSGHRSIGFEINAYAALATRLKLSCPIMNLAALRRSLKRFSLFMEGSAKSDNLRPKATPPPDFRGRVPFFSPHVERQVLLVLDFVQACKEKWIRDFFRLALGSVMVAFSNYSYEPSLGTRRGAGKPDIADAPVGKILTSKMEQMIADVDEVQEKIREMGRVPRCAIYQESYLTTTRLSKQSVDLLITSPPSLNNYHYIRNTRPQLFWLDLIAGRDDLRQLERTSFGCFWQTVRGDPPIHLTFSYPDLEAVIEAIRNQSVEKGLLAVSCG